MGTMARPGDIVETVIDPEVSPLPVVRNEMASSTTYKDRDCIARSITTIQQVLHSPLHYHSKYSIYKSQSSAGLAFRKHAVIRNPSGFCLAGCSLSLGPALPTWWCYWHSNIQQLQHIRKDCLRAIIRYAPIVHRTPTLLATPPNSAEKLLTRFCCI